MSFGNTEPVTSEVEMRWDAIRDIGCLACRLRHPTLVTACEVHHLTVGGKHGQRRRGHMATIGLCPWHHRGVPNTCGRQRLRQWLGPSYAHEPVTFRETFGDDAFLLQAQDQLIASYRALTGIRPTLEHRA